MTPGRPKKSGKRFPCGKRTPAARDEEITGIAVQARLRTKGFKPDRRYPTTEDIQKGKEGMTGTELARSNILGCPLNELQHWGYVTPTQAIAGHDFAQTMREYLATAKLQKPTQGKAGFVPATPDNGEGPAVRSEAKARAYMEALGNIDRIDFTAPSATSIVWDICINENDRRSEAEVGALRVGLNAIARVMNGKKAA